MAREILFKAKRRDNGEWVEGYLVKCRTSEEEGYAIKDTVYHVNDGIINLIPCIVDENTICQYTGLTDKNGNKIWENDIVRYTDELVGMVKQDLIVWSGDCCSFARKHKSKYTAGFQYLWINERTSKELEVIGNIFDNPELLTE